MRENEEPRHEHLALLELGVFRSFPHPRGVAVFGEVLEGRVL